MSANSTKKMVSDDRADNLAANVAVATEDPSPARFLALWFGIPFLILLACGWAMGHC